MRTFALRLAAICAVLTLGALQPPKAAACSCMVTGPACENFYRVDYVFEGTVMSVGETTSLQVIGNREMSFPQRLVHFQVNRAWKGVSQSEVDVVTGVGGGDCGYDFKVGVKYLVFGYQHEGRINAGICSATRPSAEAAEDVTWLETLARPALGGTVFGQVTREDQSLSWTTSPRRVPMDGIRIALDGPDKTRETVARAGRYEFSNLPVGRYMVRADFGPTLRPLHAPLEVEIPDLHACGQRDLWTAVNGRITGMVVEQDGTPASEIQVEAAPAGTDLDARNYQRFSARTDNDGRFEISGLPSGAFVVGVNLANRISEFTPYPRALVSGSDDRPALIAVGTGEAVALPALKLPRASWLKVSGRVEGLQPNLGAFVEAQSVPRGARAVASRQTDFEGAFTIRLPPGVYVLEARSWDPNANKVVARGHSDPITVRDGDVRGIKIHLNPEP